MRGTLPRRRFVRHAATVAGAAVVAPGLLAACGDGPEQGTVTQTPTTDARPTGQPSTPTTGRPTGQPNTFRLSSRHVRNPCNACVSHNRNRYYATAETADADRPHEGCNCNVQGQIIPDADATTFFAAGRSVFDRRTA